jgi:3-dehydroquinate synthase
LEANRFNKLEKIIITTENSVSGIMVGARWEAVIKLLPDTGVVIVTDSNVYELYGNSFPPFPVLKLKPGESSKQLKVIERLSLNLLKLGVGRDGFILAIGGGVVCDVAGFLASVYMRGIRCGYVSTTLLSQVDASTGGKNGVNLGNIKNVIGNFKQPEFVICDTTMLRTLPDEEFRSGLAELIKTGFIGDTSIIETLENNYQAVIKRDKELLSDLVAKSIKFKGYVVAEDEKENNLRRILNFGHTFGHAIELHESFKHGFAVASGMELSALFSVRKKLLKKSECDRAINILKKYGLLNYYKIPVNKIEELILHDKKKTGQAIHFVFLKGIGKAVVEKLPVKEVIEFYSCIK